MDTPMQRLGLSLVEVPIAIGLGFAAFWGVYALGCAITHCVDMSGVGWALLGVIVGLAIGIAYWIAMLRMAPRLPVRLMLDAMALAIGLGAYLIPGILSERSNARGVAAIAKSYQSMHQQRANWIKSLKAHSHGAPGEVPPMLSVVDEVEGAVVTNVSSRSISVGLARVLPDPTGPGGWRACQMSPVDMPYFQPTIDPQKSVHYQLTPACRQKFAGAPIEYRVGNGPPQDGWWSDSAIATPDWPKMGSPDRSIPGGGTPKSPPTMHIGVAPKPH